MLILIAESKTMTPCDNVVTEETLSHNLPVYKSIADSIMADVDDMPAKKLADATRLSPQLTRKLKEMAYEFPNMHIGEKAIRSYTGVVFKALSYSTLSPEAKETCSRQVRIISSLYGWLRPEDIIKPYRLDFPMKLMRSVVKPYKDVALSAFWKDGVTKALINTLKTSGDTEILDLLPAEAAKCIDWNQVKEIAHVSKVDFLSTDNSLKSIPTPAFDTTLKYCDETFSSDFLHHLKTPNATKLKTFRGYLLRHILENGISTQQQLLNLESDIFMPIPIPEIPERLLFLV